MFAFGFRFALCFISPGPYCFVCRAASRYFLVLVLRFSFEDEFRAELTEKRVKEEGRKTHEHIKSVRPVTRSTSPGLTTASGADKLSSFVRPPSAPTPLLCAQSAHTKHTHSPPPPAVTNFFVFPLWISGPAQTQHNTSVIRRVSRSRTTAQPWIQYS